MTTPNYRLSDEDLGKLYNCLAELEKNPQRRRRCFAIRFLLAAGIKSHELLALRFRNILLEYDPPIIFVKARLKTERMPYVQVNQEFGRQLRAHVRKVNGHGRPDDFVIPGREREKPAGRRTLIMWWDAVLAKAGLPHIGMLKAVRNHSMAWTSERLPRPQYVSGCAKMFKISALTEHLPAFCAEK